MQTISTIAREISREWKNVNYAAKPYLQAMRSLDSASDSFGYDSAKSVVSYFLANASGYPEGSIYRFMAKTMREATIINHDVYKEQVTA